MKKTAYINEKIKRFNKRIYVPGDKSLSIRFVLMASQAIGKSVAYNLLYSEDVLSALNVIRKLRNDELLFGECQSLIIVTLEESDMYELILLSTKLDVHTQTIGRVTDTDSLVINDLIDIPRKKLSDAYYNSLDRIMAQ